jgi:hypothetical protein
MAKTDSPKGDGSEREIRRLPQTGNDAQPGGLAFYPDCEHVGIVVVKDIGMLTIIHCASGSNNVFAAQCAQGDGFIFIGRPPVNAELGMQ